jgi:predicted nucleotidyltransferase
MLPFSQKHVDLFKVLKVEAIYLFGSRALDSHTPLSDYDYAVLIPAGHFKGDAAYQELYSVLGEISPRTLENDQIDIVFLRDTGLELKFHVIRHGRVIYDAIPLKRLQFENMTQLLYCDFRPLLDEFDAALLQSL